MRDSSFWSVTFTRALNIYATLIFVVLWVGLVIILVVNREGLDVFWNWAQGLSSVPRIIVWVMILPIMVGLWIWESSWPALVRLVGFTGIVAWTILAVANIYRAFR